MTGNAIKGEALELHDLSSEELDAVSGGFFGLGSIVFGGIGGMVGGLGGGTGGDTGGDTGGGQNDPAQMFQQILQQLTNPQ
jgi:hypothetical protein